MNKRLKRFERRLKFLQTEFLTLMEEIAEAGLKAQGTFKTDIGEILEGDTKILVECLDSLDKATMHIEGAVMTLVLSDQLTAKPN